MRSIARRRPACASRSWCAESVHCAPASTASPKTSPCAQFSDSILEHSRILQFPRDRRILDRQRRHDAPQPRSARRSAGSGQGSATDRTTERHLRVGAGPRHALLGTGAGSTVEGDAASGSHGSRPPGVADGAAPQRLRPPVAWRRCPHARRPELTCRSYRCRHSPRRMLGERENRLRRRCGAVASRAPRVRVEVAVIHRPRYDDWSLPKGKVDPGETEPVTTVRELFEETGHHAQLGRRIAER